MKGENFPIKLREPHWKKTSCKHHLEPSVTCTAVCLTEGGACAVKIFCLSLPQKKGNQDGGWRQSKNYCR